MTVYGEAASEENYVTDECGKHFLLWERDLAFAAKRRSSGCEMGPSMARQSHSSGSMPPARYPRSPNRSASCSGATTTVRPCFLGKDEPPTGPRMASTPSLSKASRSTAKRFGSTGRTPSAFSGPLLQRQLRPAAHAGPSSDELDARRPFDV